MPDAPAAPAPPGGAGAGVPGALQTSARPGAKAPVIPLAKGAPAVEPEFRYKDKIRVFGEDQDVDYSREDLRRELQISKANAKRIAEAQGMDARARKLFESDPEEFLKLRGLDPDEWASKRLAAKAKLGIMTPEQREIYEAKAERDALKARVDKHEKDQEDQVHQSEMTRIREKNVQGLQAAFTKMDLPANYETTYLAAETAKLALDAGIDLTEDPDLWARETMKRLDTFTRRFVTGLSGQQLLTRLGDDVVERILEAKLESFNKSQGIPGAARAPRKAPPEPQGEKQQFIDPYEWRRRLKEK